MWSRSSLELGCNAHVGRKNQTIDYHNAQNLSRLYLVGINLLKRIRNGSFQAVRKWPVRAIGRRVFPAPGEVNERARSDGKSMGFGNPAGYQAGSRGDGDERRQLSVKRLRAVCR